MGSAVKAKKKKMAKLWFFVNLRDSISFTISKKLMQSYITRKLNEKMSFLFVNRVISHSVWNLTTFMRVGWL